MRVWGDTGLAGVCAALCSLNHARSRKDDEAQTPQASAAQGVAGSQNKGDI